MTVPIRRIRFAGVFLQFRVRAGAAKPPCGSPRLGGGESAFWNWIWYENGSRTTAKIHPGGRERVVRITPGSVEPVSIRYVGYPPSSVSTFCDCALAIAKMLLPAWTRICALVNSDVSAAKSVSRITDSDAVRFSTVIAN